MNSISLVILVILASILALYVLTLAWRIRNNVITSTGYREALLNRLASLRLNRMLQALGINKHRYAYQQSILDIEQQMKNCRQCEHTDECDENATQHNQSASNIPYCPNANALNESLKRQNQV